MPKKKIGPYPIYNPDHTCFDFWGVEIFDLDEFLGLQLRYRDSNALARYSQKEAEWDRLVWQVTINRMYDWKDEYIEEHFAKNAKMYLPNKYYQRLLREMAA